MSKPASGRVGGSHTRHGRRYPAAILAARCAAQEGDFRPDVDLGQIAARCACGVSVSASPRMIGAPSPRTSRAGTSGSAGDHPCARPSPARLRSTATTLIRPPATQRDQGATGGSGARPLSDIPGTEFKSLALDALQPAGSNRRAKCREILQQRGLPCRHQCG